MISPPRYLPDIPFPPYTYVPGRTPHPISDPNGHMHGEEHEPVDFDIENWQNCTAYLRGIDLFNNGYYWEAHEAWEALWHAAGRTGPIADFLKGLIKLAAAGVKTLEGSKIGRQRHARRAAELLQSVSSQDDHSRLMGVKVRQIAGFAEAVAGDHFKNESDRDTIPAFDFHLIPESTLR